MNYKAIIGRVTNDPIYGKTTGGVSYLKFGVATDRPGRDKTDFHSCIVWSGLADSAHKYLKKGRLIFISGQDLSDTYEKDGVVRTSWTLHGRELQYLDKGGAREENLAANVSGASDYDKYSPWRDD